MSKLTAKTPERASADTGPRARHRSKLTCSRREAERHGLAAAQAFLGRFHHLLHQLACAPDQRHAPSAPRRTAPAHPDARHKRVCAPCVSSSVVPFSLLSFFVAEAR
eukprot:322865-Rhodomonas_salina.3